MEHYLGLLLIDHNVDGALYLGVAAASLKAGALYVKQRTCSRKSLLWQYDSDQKHRNVRPLDEFARTPSSGRQQARANSSAVLLNRAPRNQEAQIPKERWFV